MSTSPIQLTASVAQPISCFGNADAEIQLTATGNVGTTSYILNNDTNTTGIFAGLGNGFYTAMVMDTSGCSQTLAAIQLTEPSQVSFNTTYTGSLLCANDSNATIQINATGGNGSYFYSIDTTSFFTTDLFQNLGAGDYSLTVKDTAGCLADTQMITISAPNPFFLTGTTEAISCHNYQDGSIDGLAVGGTGANSYTLNGSTTQASGLFQNLGAGFYTMVAADSNGCNSNTISLALQNPFAMVVSLWSQQSILCANTSTGILFAAQMNGNLPISYSLNGGPLSAVDTFVNLSAGAYSVVAIDAKGCTATSQIANLYNPPILTGSAQIIQNITCYNGADGSVQLVGSGGNPGYTYSLDGSTFNTSAVITNISAGIYSPAVKDQNGCITTIGQISLSNPTQIAVTFQVSYETAAGNDAELTLIANGGAGNYTYSIDGTNYQTSPTFTGLSGGLISFYVKDGNGCILTGSTYIDSSVGIEEIENKSFHVYPNPTKNSFVVTHANEYAVSIELINQLGQSLLIDNEVYSGKNIVLENVPPAIYYLKISLENKLLATKQIVVVP